MRRGVWIVLGLLAVGPWISACGQARSAPEPERVTVQHLLVSFSGRLPGKTVTRSKEEAEKLAHELLERARKGEDFDALVKQYTDDQHPGFYTLVNKSRSQAAGEYGREQLVAGFGDVSFKLQPGEVGLCEYDATRSPYGYHLIKRIE
jgi:parvulin-like peptidyl-prolyl cis-trans isomerase-like protein